MLLQTILLPNALATVPVDATGQKLGCNVLLSILRDLLDNCVVVIPSQHSDDRAYFDAVASWPIKYRPRALEVLRMLKLRNRFVSSGVPYNPIKECDDAVCQPYVGLGLSNALPVLIVRDDCHDCTTKQGLNGRTVEAFDYLLSDLSRTRKEQCGRILADGQWTQTDFENRILAPIFAYAKHVKIYDRYIGRSIFDRHRKIASISPSYKMALEWIIDVYKRSGAGTRGGVFEINCGINIPRLSPANRARIKSVVHAFETHLQTTSALPVSINLKQESSTQQLPHGRYLVTDQVAVLIERGFDLLWDNQRMTSQSLRPGVDPRPVRDTAIMLCADCQNVESKSRLLPNF